MAVGAIRLSRKIIFKFAQDCICLDCRQDTIKHCSGVLVRLQDQEHHCGNSKIMTPDHHIEYINMKLLEWNWTHQMVSLYKCILI